MELTIIISYYKAINNLKLILKALEHQSFMGFEVILSEDDYNKSTFEYLLNEKEKFHFPITHIYQSEDRGFRKNEMLNRAILQSKTEKLVFIDGDCIPHRNFVKHYFHEIKEGYYCDGRAVMLSKKVSEDIITKGSLSILNVYNILLSNSDKKKDAIYFPLFPLSLKIKGRGLVGRNWGISKKDIIAVNGFDMDYKYAGVGEDVDIEWRLKANGIKSISMKNKAIVYHLHHLQVYSEEMVEKNFELMYKKQKENQKFCKNGLDKINI